MPYRVAHWTALGKCAWATRAWAGLRHWTCPRTNGALNSAHEPKIAQPLREGPRRQAERTKLSVLGGLHAKWRTKEQLYIRTHRPHSRRRRINCPLSMFARSTTEIAVMSSNSLPMVYCPLFPNSDGKILCNFPVSPMPSSTCTQSSSRSGAPP